jgi:hypothetical protein
MKYESLERNSLSLFNKYIINNESLKSLINQELDFFNLYCQENPLNISSSELYYSINFSNYNIKLPCHKINSSEELINESIKSLIKEAYFKEYDCNLIDCFSKEPTPVFLISQKTNNLLKKTFFIFLIASLCFSIFIFLLLKNKINLLFFISLPLILSSFVLIKINSLIFSIINENDLIKEIINILFYNLTTISKRLLIFSLILLFLWILLKLFKSSVKINEKIEKIKDSINDFKEYRRQKKLEKEKIKNTNLKETKEIQKENSKEEDF